MNQATYKADGGFLWARIAVNDLIDGVLAKDTLKTLHERLMTLNGTLNGIFEQLLKRIHPLHQVKAANYIRFEKIWQKHSGSDLSVLALALACEVDFTKETNDLIICQQHGHCTKEAANKYGQKLHDFEASLSSRCAGLRDVKMVPQYPSRRCGIAIWEVVDAERSLEDSDMCPLAQHCYNFQVGILSSLVLW